MSTNASINFDGEVIAEIFEWCALIKHITVVIIAEVVIVICVAVAFVGLIKIFQARTCQKDQLRFAEQNRYQLNQQQQNFTRINSTIESLGIFYTKFRVYYALYKQLLYLKTGAFHGTSMNSIFASVSKSSVETHNNLQPSSFQQDSLQRLHKLIIADMFAIISTFHNILTVLSSSNLIVKGITRKQTLKHSQHHFQLSYLLKYHLPSKKAFLELRDKVDLLEHRFLTVKDLNHQQFVQLVRNSVFLVCSFSEFLHNLKNRFIQCPSSHHKESLPESQPIQIQIDSTISKICSSSLTTDKNLSEQKQSNYTVLVQAKEKLSKSISLFLSNQHLNFTQQKNKVAFLDQKIQELTKLFESVQIIKSSIEKQKDQQKQSQTQIKVYSTNNENPFKESQSIQNSLQPPSRNTSTVHQSQTAFSSQNKLSFIKQLDRLMVRNKIRKQMEEMQEKIKLQEHLESLQNNLSEKSPQIILEKNYQ